MNEMNPDNIRMITEILKQVESVSSDTSTDGLHITISRWLQPALESFRERIDSKDGKRKQKEALGTVANRMISRGIRETLKETQQTQPGERKADSSGNR